MGKLLEVYRKNKHVLFVRDIGHFGQELGFLIFFKEAQHVVESPLNFTCFDEDVNIVLFQLAFLSLSILYNVL